MLVLHANWSEQRLHLWAERPRRSSSLCPESLDARNGDAATIPEEGDSSLNGMCHPETSDVSSRGARGFAAATSSELLDWLRVEVESVATHGLSSGRLRLQWPTVQGRLESSDVGEAGAFEDLPSKGQAADEAVGDRAGARLDIMEVQTVAVAPDRVLAVLGAIDRLATMGTASWRGGASLDYWILVARFMSELLVGQRFIPTLYQGLGGEVRGAWRLWLSDEESLRRVSMLTRDMPPSARAVADGFAGDAWAILDDCLSTVADDTIRRVFAENEIHTAIEERDPTTDQHVAWLSSLLGRDAKVALPVATAVHLMRGVRTWLGRLYEVGQGRAFHLCFELHEPDVVDRGADLFTPDDRVLWTLSFHLRSSEEPGIRVAAGDAWAATGDVLFVEGLRVDRPQELLLSELKRASTIYPALDRALEEARPLELELTTARAHAFLREYRRVLEESGFGVILPPWWDRPDTRLSARLKVHSDDWPLDAALGIHAASAGEGAGPATLGLDSIVQYQWQIAIGQHVLTREEFERLALQRSPLVRLHGQWVEIRPRDIAGAQVFWQQEEAGQTTLRDALRMAYGPQRDRIGLPVLGMDADGWVGRLFGSTVAAREGEADSGARAGELMPLMPQPESFIGHLRPYQIKGLSWLAFLDRFGLGGCLADDMGLGKTIQVIALLLAEREQAPDPKAVRPTLLVVPTSVVGNWVRELRRFSPNLRVLVHHGIERSQGERFVEQALQKDVVITTYALAHRDRETLGGVRWWRVCLDEAQNIKNPAAKQTTAVRDLPTDRRIALTGTPVENRLSELWSIMDFLNSGYLGTAGEFRREFALNIERYRDPVRVEQLRNLVQPFVLRRLKTDPHVIADLPEKLEYKVYCTLTAEQARLYETTVAAMLQQADEAEGIQRRGVVLATLVKLKQICNHPAQFLREQQESEGVLIPSSLGPLEAKRSGKAARLVEMLEEVLAEGDSALVFTQFRQMGHVLSAMIRRDLGVEPLFLHGGTPTAKREEMIERFQNRDGSAPIFILSLKAGGFGLNLTAANHVFHFDRWWNPAVENQATGRAFRIGQTRAVQVHKFICSGTLEERIDQMIEQKVELAENVIGSGEAWLTELSTDQLRDLLALRYEEVTQDIDASLADAPAPGDAEAAVGAADPMERTASA